MSSYVDKLLGRNEKIALTTRQHWFVLFRETFKELLFALLIIILATAAFFFPPIAPFAPFVYILLLFPALGLVYDYMIWWNREYIVTNHRVVQVNGVLNKSVIDSSLEKVNDVKMSQSFFGRLFNYGDIEILTASELGVNLFQRINDPIKFKTVMLDAKESLGHEEMPTTPSDGFRPSDLPALLANLEALRKRGVLTEAEFQQKKAELLKTIKPS
jgi:hypothetical protein